MNTKRINKPTALIFSLSFLAGAFAVAGMTAPSSAMAEKNQDRVGNATAALCSQETWPSVSQGCLQWTGGMKQESRIVRVVTVEKRNEAERTSVLVKLPVKVVAAR